MTLAQEVRPGFMPGVLTPPQVEANPRLPLREMLPREYVRIALGGLEALQLLDTQNTPEIHLRNAGFSEATIQNLKRFPSYRNQPDLSFYQEHVQATEAKDIYHIFAGNLKGRMTTVSLIAPNSIIDYPGRKVPSQPLDRNPDLQGFKEIRSEEAPTILFTLKGEMSVQTGNKFEESYWLHEGHPFRLKPFDGLKPRRIITWNSPAFFIETMPKNVNIHRVEDLKLPGYSAPVLPVVPEELVGL